MATCRLVLMSLVGVAALVSLVGCARNQAREASPALPGQLAALQGSSGEERLALVGADGRVRVATGPIGASHIAWSPDGRTIAFNGQEEGRSELSPWAQIWLFDVEGDRLTNLRALPCPARTTGRVGGGNVRPLGGEDPTWSPDGSALAFVFEFRIWTYGFAKGTLTPITAFAPRFGMSAIRDTHWAPTGEWISFSASEWVGLSVPTAPWRRFLFVVHPNGTDLRRVPEEGVGPAYYMMSWAPDGQRVAVNSPVVDPTMNRVRVIDVTAGTVEATVLSAAGGLAWSPDGRTIAAPGRQAGGPFQIRLLHVASGEITTLTNSGRDERDVAWSPDGCWLAFGRQYAEGWRVVLRELDSGREVVVAGAEGEDLGDPAWRPQPPASSE